MAVNSSSNRDRLRKVTSLEKQKKERKRRNLFAVAAVLVMVTVAVFVVVLISGNVYKNEQQFQTYATRYFEEAKSEGQAQTQAQSAHQEELALKYDIPLSTAVEYPTVENKRVQEHIKVATSNLKREYKARNEKAKEDDTIVLLVKCQVFDSPKAASGLVLDVTEQKAKGRTMKTTGSWVETYNFSTKTGLPLTSYQVFKTNYRKFCSQFFMDYFEKEYKKDLVPGKYKKNLANKEANFNDFVLTDQGVRFHFKKGTVVKNQLGQICVDVDYEELSDLIYKKALVRYIDPNKPMVALTFDDGPDGKNTTRILKCLEKNGAVATFFYLGRNVKAHPKAVKKTAKLGMEIGNHSWSHPDMRKTNAKTIKKQIKKTDKMLLKTCGLKGELFRPPYGSTNAKVKKHAKAPVILWSVDTLDWKSRNSKKVFKSVKKVKKLDGKVVLMHSIYPSTAKATEKMVPWLIENGYQLVTVSELLEYHYHEKPKKGKLYGYEYFKSDKKSKKTKKSSDKKSKKQKQTKKQKKAAN